VGELLGEVVDEFELAGVLLGLLVGDGLDDGDVEVVGVELGLVVADVVGDAVGVVVAVPANWNCRL